MGESAFWGGGGIQGLSCAANTGEAERGIPPAKPPLPQPVSQWSPPLQPVGLWGERFPAELKTEARRKAAGPTQRQRCETQRHKRAGLLES